MTTTIEAPKVSKVCFQFQKCTKNPKFEDGIKSLPLRSCLIDDNDTQHKHVKTEPKWFTELSYRTVDNDTGELLGNGKYQTDEFKKSNQRKILTLDKFCNTYQPLYTKRKVSLLFHTFTQANNARMTFRRMLHLLRKRYKALDIEILGFIWTAEVSKKLHWHYHCCVAVRRIRVKKIPDGLKLQGLWGRRTGVEFVKKNVRHYMAKYWAKDNYRVIGTRSMGKSKFFLN